MARSRLRSKARRWRNRVRSIRQVESFAYWRRRPIRADTVLYESFAGNGLLCNPEAILRALLAAPDMQHLEHVLVLADLSRYSSTVREFSSHPNVRFVEHKSPAYYRALATSKYLVNNATFPPQFGKRSGQVYLNTWHGTPLKKMGYDTPNGGPETRNVIRNFVNADYLLSGSEFMTRQMYETSYRLTGMYRGRIIQEGFPRIDRQVVPESEAAAWKATLRDRGVAVDDRKIVLYAPTWKGASFYRPADDAEQLRDRVAALNERIDTSRYRVLLKVHQQAYKFAAARADLRDILVPNDLPSNAVLGITDVLVSDYSSIFFDFLATGRPILFFVPDLAQYTDDRGVYLTPEQWPGPVTDSIDQLADYLNGLGTGGDTDVRVTYAARYDKCVAEYCPRDDGHAGDRVVDIVFRSKTEGYDVRSDFSDDRQSILIYPGMLRDNAVTNALLSLLNNIDYDRFDVSLLYNDGRRTAEQRRVAAALNPNVRHFPYLGRLNGSKRHALGRRALLTKGMDAPLVNMKAQRQLFRDEFRRMFGSCEFDYVLDFSGYSPFWAFLLLEGPARTHAVWMHNDMSTGRMRQAMGAIASAYRRYDRLVSVSPALRDINRRALGSAVGDAEFTYATDTVDFRRVLEMAEEDLLAEPTVEADEPADSDDATAAADDGAGDATGSDEEAGDPTGPDGGAEADADVGAENATTDAGADVADGLDPKAEARRIAADNRERERRAMLVSLLQPDRDLVTFATTGRLTSEKNHERLIRAFGQVHADRPATRLVIIGGGPLRARLDAVIAELGLSEAVIMAGPQANPYPILAAADCFVLASDHEVQPTAILEARALGRSVVATEFDTVRSALPDGTGLVVARSVDGLADGLRDYLRGAVPNPTFDHVAYNERAIGQFYSAIGAADAGS